MTTLKADTGKQLSQVQLSTESEVDSEASIIHVGSRSAGPMIVWADATRKHIKANVLGKKSVGLLSAPTREDLRDISIHSVRSEKSPGHFLVKFQTEKYSHVEVYNVDGKSGTFRKAYNLPLLKGKAAFSASLVDGNVLFTKNTPSEATLYSSSSPDPLEQWTPRSNHTEGSEPEEMIQAVSEVVPKAGSKYAVRSALVRTSGDWEVVQNGEPLWVRNEGLAGVVSAAWAEIPRQESLVQELEVESHTNIAAAYIHRVKRHISDLEHLPNWLRSIPKRIITSFTGQSLGQEFDGFGFSKLIIAATEKGRVIAIESGKQGQVRWNVKATTLDGGAVWNVTDIVVENGLAIITATGGEYVSLELESGKVREKQARGLLPNVFKLAFVTSSNGKRLTLPLSEEGQPVDPLTEDAGSSTYIVTQGSDGSVRGWHLVGGKSPISSWTFRPPPGETISAVTSRPAHDPVASIGRALGDRNVLYKFLSPNLILVITTSSSRASATAYLLDSITGRTLHTTTHNAIDTSQPIAATFSENWFAYTLASDPALAPPHLTATTPKAPLLAIAELYESPIPNDRGPLSAAPNTSSIHSPLHAPHVLAATHVLPAPLAALATTATLQGITPRTLLAYCPPLAAVYALPYHPLSPRRPVGRDATADEREEGLLPYAAPLELFAHWSLSHRREVLGIARIVAEPTRMESSSLVLAYGALDLFATREAPIGAFDVLGSGFGRWSLVLTVVGLAAGTAVLAPMVSAYSCVPWPCGGVLVLTRGCAGAEEAGDEFLGWLGPGGSVGRLTQRAALALSAFCPLDKRKYDRSKAASINEALCLG